MTAKVLATYELLEAVLHGLPSKDLLLCQRVCRTWRDLVTRSQKLQRALFLLPVGGGTLINQWRETEDARDLWSYPGSITAMKVFANPLLIPLKLAMHGSTDIKLEQRLSRSWRRSEASWRKMFLSQPPTIVEVADKLGFRAYHQEKLTYARDLVEPVDRVYDEPEISHCCWVKGGYLWDRLEDNTQLEILPAERPKDEHREDDFDDDWHDWY